VYLHCYSPWEEVQYGDNSESKRIRRHTMDTAAIKDIINKKIYEALQDKIEYEDITPNKKLIEDFNADSLEIVEIVVAIMEEFDVTIEMTEDVTILTVEDIYNYILERI